MWPVCAVSWLNRPSECITGIERNHFCGILVRLFTEVSVTDTTRKFRRARRFPQHSFKKKPANSCRHSRIRPNCDDTHTLSGQHHGMDILLCVRMWRQKVFISRRQQPLFISAAIKTTKLLLHSPAWKKPSSIKYKVSAVKTIITIHPPKNPPFSVAQLILGR